MSVTMSIDPSGNGVTGVCVFKNFCNVLFFQYEGKLWEDHFRFIFSLIKKEKPVNIIYENTNYIHKRLPGSLNLLKLIGSIVSTKYFFEFVENLEGVTVNSVKSMKKKIFSGVEKIEGLSFLVGRGRGWMYMGKRISLHQLDAMIIYHIWTNGALEEAAEISEKIEILCLKKKLGKNQKKSLERLQKILDQKNFLKLEKSKNNEQKS